MRRNTVSNLRFFLVMYVLYTPSEKAAFSLSFLHLASFFTWNERSENAIRLELLASSPFRFCGKL